MTLIIWFPLTALVLLTAGCHFLARKCRWSKGHWLTLEYIWKLAGCISLVTLTATNTSNMKKFDLESTTQRLDYELGSLLESADYNANHYGDEKLYAQWDSLTNKIAGYKDYAAWCRDLEKGIKTRDYSELAEKQSQAEQRANSGQAVAREYSEVNRQLSSIKRHVATVQHLRQLSGVEVMEAVMKYFLLPFSFALYITRTSVERYGWIGESRPENKDEKTPA